MDKIVVTRHPALIEYLKQEHLIGSSTKVISHATAKDITGKHVIGVLPHNLSCLTYRYTEVPLNLPFELRGKELNVETVRRFAGKPVTYQIIKEEEV